MVHGLQGESQETQMLKIHLLQVLFTMVQGLQGESQEIKKLKYLLPGWPIVLGLQGESQEIFNV